MPLVRLLGPVDVVDDVGHVQVPGSPIRRSLLALLALEAGRVVDAERLIDLAWDGQPPASGVRALRFHISKLRSELSIEDLIVTVGGGYRLDADVDITEPDATLSAAAAVDVERCRSALSLWRGDPFSDAGPCAALEHERQRLSELHLALRERLFRLRIDNGEAAAIVGDLTRVCLDHPLREGLWAALMEAHWLAGNQAEALRSYDLLRLNLVETLGVEPGPEVQRLHLRILTDSGPESGGSVSEPTVEEPRSSYAELPIVDDALIGRDQDVDEVSDLVERSRLITIVGTGGIGKTRLAVEVASRAEHRFSDGVWFCELAPVATSEAVAHAIGQRIGARQHPGKSMSRSIAEYCRHRELLLVLDNCEHVLDATSELVDALAAVAPGVKVLVTSREALGSAHEYAYPLPSLAVGPPGAVAEELFLRRAAQSAPRRVWSEAELETIHRICDRLDGIPLAIELAASRTSALSLDELESHLDSAFQSLRGGRRRIERHRTLEAAIDWSYQSLPESEKTLFCRLSVFAGGCDLEAIRAVCDEPTPSDPYELVDRIDGLIGKSLLVTEKGPAGRTRYRLLEPLRQYAEDRLSLTGDSFAIRSAHLRHYTAWAADWDSRPPAGGLEWKQELEAELANLRSAAAWAIDTDDLDHAIGLVGALDDAVGSFLLFEIGDWATAMLDMAGIGDRVLGPAVAMTAAMSYWWRSDLPAFHRYRTLATTMASASPSNLATATAEAILCTIDGNYQGALQIYDRVDRSDPRDDVRIAWLRGLASISVDAEVTKREIAKLREFGDSLDSALYRSIGDVLSAQSAIEVKDYERAIEHARRGAEAAGSVGTTFFVHHNVIALAVATGVTGASTSADRALIVRSLREQRDLGQTLDQWLILGAIAIGLAGTDRVDVSHAILHGLGTTPWAASTITKRLEHALAGTPSGRSEPPPGTTDRDRLVDLVIELFEADRADPGGVAGGTNM